MRIRAVLGRVEDGADGEGLGARAGGAVRTATFTVFFAQKSRERLGAHGKVVADRNGGSITRDTLVPIPVAEEVVGTKIGVREIAALQESITAAQLPHVAIHIHRPVFLDLDAVRERAAGGASEERRRRNLVNAWE